MHTISGEDGYILKLFDITGHEVFNESLNSNIGDYTHNLNLACFHKGVYILEIQGAGFNKYISLIIH